MEREFQPFLVDTSTCYCRVNGGLKIIVGEKIFLFVMKLWMQSKTRCMCRIDVGLKSIPGVENPKTVVRIQHIKPPVHPSGFVWNHNQPTLLPGLPDDLAVACLIRVQRIAHPKLRLVCKRWYKLLKGTIFYSLRKKLGLAEEWIYVIKRDRDENISFHAFDPINQLWQPLPPLPRNYSKYQYNFGSAVLNDCHLYLFGEPSGRVTFYNALTNKWYQAPDMLQTRYVSGSCVIKNCLYVAGGVSNEDGRPFMKSAEVYDPTKNRWSFIAEMESKMVPFVGVLYNGKWFLEGIASRQREIVKQVYHPETDKWFPVHNGLVAGWTKPYAFMNEHVYEILCLDGCRLSVYDMATNSRTGNIDTKLHFGDSLAFATAALVPLNGKLCIVRNDMSVSVVDESTKSNDVGRGAVDAYHLWEPPIERKKEPLSTYITDIWSKISENRRVCRKSRVLHCQVLKV